MRPTATNSSSSPNSPTSSEQPPNSRGDGDLAPPLAELDGRRASRRFSNLFGVLDRRRLAEAEPQERLAALRELREQQRAHGETAEDAAERRRRHRLTARLQDVFSVRTTGVGNTTESSTAAPTAPAAASQAQGTSTETSPSGGLTPAASSAPGTSPTPPPARTA